MIRFLFSLALGASVLLAPAAEAQRRTASPEHSLRLFLRAQLRDADRETRYVVAWADLNGDRRPEALVYLLGSDFCGTGGCTLEVLTPAGRSWRLMTRMTVVQAPIRLLATSSHGWRDIGVSQRELRGNHFGRYEARLRFDRTGAVLRSGAAGVSPWRRAG
jgi:hypothetical protein